jgi:two-component system OmpR family sensor kinase
MRSFSVKLAGAFVAVILVGAAITYLVAGQGAAGQVRLYAGRSGQLRAQAWAVTLASYYAQNGSWAGVETLLSSSSDLGPQGMMHGPGGAMMGRGPFGVMGGPAMGIAMGDRLILAGPDGRVLLDTGGTLAGQTLAPADLAGSTPVVVDGQTVGRLLVSPAQSGAAAALAVDFLAGVNRAVLLAALAAGGVALVLAAVLVRQIIAPLGKLRLAAHAITQGDLTQRVSISSQDEIGEVAAAFNQMAAALERNERLRRDMMADVAHELRTPLTVIQGQVEALLDGVFPLTPDQLMPIHEETLLLARLVADLRELALAEAGQLAIDRLPVDVGELAERVAAAVEPAAADKGLTLTTSVAPGLPPVSADADRLRQVLHNLLANALRYTPDGGQVIVSVRLASSTEEIGLQAKGRGAEEQGSKGDSPLHPYSSVPLLVSVADSGPGIPAEDLPYVFDRFYRADKSRSRAGGGSGLGLAIARSIVEAHGGRIWAESRPGQGTRIAFTIPQ